MPTSDRRGRSSPRGGRRRATSTIAEPLPMVEVVLTDVEGDDWVTETLRTQGVVFRLLACRPADRGRRRLLRLFELQTNGSGLGPVLDHLRSRVAVRDLAVSVLSPERSLLRVSVPMPPTCSAAFDLGDFCVSCPFLGGSEGRDPASWNLLVPRIGDARRLLAASRRDGRPRPSLVRAGAYRRRWGLTGRQERALRTAYQIGYFDYPRKASLSALAVRLGVTRSTALELLRKATTKLAAERFVSDPSSGRSL